MPYIILLVLAGCGSGIINTVADGGILLVLPVLLALGLDPFTAAVTGSVVLAPASCAAAYGYRRDIPTIPRRYFGLFAPALLGGALGVFLLHRTPGSLFARLLPWLVLVAVALFIFQPQLHRRLRRPVYRRGYRSLLPVGCGLFLICVYGGYFGAGVSFLILVLLGFTKIQTIFQMTGLKSLLTALLALMTIATFGFTGRIAWHYGLLGACGSAMGGYLGARWSHRISPHAVRLVIGVVGIVVIIMTFGRAYR